MKPDRYYEAARLDYIAMCAVAERKAKIARARKVCASCDGKKTKLKYTEPDGVLTITEVTCPTCKGRGKIRCKRPSRKRKK